MYGGLFSILVLGGAAGLTFQGQPGLAEMVSQNALNTTQETLYFSQLIGFILRNISTSETNNIN